MATGKALPYVEADKRLWLPPWVENENPVDGTDAPEDRNVSVNTVPGEISVADDAVLQKVIAEHGVFPEPELGRAQLLRREAGEAEDPGAVSAQGYADTHWTHFDFRPDVGRAVVRVQKQFPWLTFANTYFWHPPVHKRIYEFVSNDYWAGGLVNGEYVGYRGKSIGSVVNGWDVFNAVFNDPHLPNIYWIIFGGRMWTRGYGWGPSPWGPPDSDPRHDHHIHVTYLL